MMRGAGNDPAAVNDPPQDQKAARPATWRPGDPPVTSPYGRWFFAPRTITDVLLRSMVGLVKPGGPTLPLPGGGVADELAHPVSSRQGFTACAPPGAIAPRALSVHHGHRRKRRTESRSRTRAEDRHKRTGEQFPQAAGYGTRIRADLSLGAHSRQSREAAGAGGGHRARDRRAACRP